MSAELSSQHAPAARSEQHSAAVLLVAAFLLAAARPGGGILAATWQSPEGQEAVVTVSYRPEKTGEGRMSMQLGAEGERFVGQYLRLKPELSARRLEPFYSTWSSDDFDDYRFGPAGAPWRRDGFTLESFRKRYSGLVVATLAGNLGSSMRCSFELADASRGLPGGASGVCQASGGDVVTLRGRKKP